MSALASVLAAIGPAPRRYPIEHTFNGAYSMTRYGPWRISFEPPPISIRSHDWAFVHDDYDASLDDGEWVGNGLGGTAASFADALNECDAIDDDREAA